MAILTIQTTTIIDFCSSFIRLILCCILLFDIIKKFKNTRLNQIVALYFLCQLLWFISNIVNDVGLYWWTDDESFYDITEIINKTFYAIADILIALFFKYRLETCYQNTFLTVNTLFMNFCVGVYGIIVIIRYVIEMLFAYISHFEPFFGTNFYLKNAFRPSDLAYIVAQFLFLLIILWLFNLKLYQFITFTDNNNKWLSKDIKKKVFQLITQQTNLVTIIILSQWIYDPIQYCFDYVPNIENDIWWRLSYIIVAFVCHTLQYICIYFTFSVNNKYYYHVACPFRCSHQLCIYCCSKCINDNSGGKKVSDLRSVQYLQTTHSHIFSVTGNETCKGLVDSCPLVSELYTLLTSDKATECNVDTRIHNIFHHLLQYHDSINEFNAIQLKLQTFCPCDVNECDKYAQIGVRKVFSRYTTDKDNDEKEEKKEIEETEETLEEMSAKGTILDRLHVYYFHGKRGMSTNTHFLGSISPFFQSIEEYSLNKYVSEIKIDDKDDHKDMYSFGIRYEYMDEHKNMYIKSKYADIKQELIDNEIVTIPREEYEAQLAKARNYIKTDAVKSMVDSNGVIVGSIIDYILSLLIYCNCDQYQSKWSESFRKLSSNECMESIKRRHQHFVHISMHLIELVERFGNSFVDVANKNKRFYHGISRILYFGQTITKFNFPLSTSTEISVARNFSYGSGLVIELQYAFSQFPLRARYFDCAPFSDYPGEKECLFIAGLPVLRITNIINVPNNEEYRKYIEAINVINGIFKGTYDRNEGQDASITEDAVDLINNRYNPAKDVPEYIQELTLRYCNGLKSMVILWDNVFGQSDAVNQPLLAMITEESECKNPYFVDLNKISELFPNLEQLEYFKGSLKKKEIKNLANMVVTELEKNMRFETKLQCIIIHHEYSSIKNIFYKSSFSRSAVSSISKDALLLNTKNSVSNKLNDHWRVYCGKKKIIIRKSDDLHDDVQFEFNDIKQGYTTLNLLNNLQ